MNERELRGAPEPGRRGIVEVWQIAAITVRLAGHCATHRRRQRPQACIELLSNLTGFAIGAIDRFAFYLYRIKHVTGSVYGSLIVDARPARLSNHC